MKTLLDIDKNYLLKIDDKKYQLLDVTGIGGSSIVYKAREDGKNKDFVVIKEFLPYSLNIQRNADGSISVPDEEKRNMKILYLEL